MDDDISVEKMLKRSVNKHVQVELFCVVADHDYDWKILKRAKFVTRFIDCDRIGQIVDLASPNVLWRAENSCELKLLMFCDLHISSRPTIFLDEHTILHNATNYSDGNIIRHYCGYGAFPLVKQYDFTDYASYAHYYLSVSKLSQIETTDIHSGWIIGKYDNEQVWKWNYTCRGKTYAHSYLLKSRGLRIFKYFNAMIDILFESESIVDLDEHDKEKFSKFYNLIKIPINTSLHLRAKNKYHLFIKCKRLKENYHKVSYCNLPFELYAIVISKLSI